MDWVFNLNQGGSLILTEYDYTSLGSWCGEEDAGTTSNMQVVQQTMVIHRMHKLYVVMPCLDTSICKIISVLKLV